MTARSRESSPVADIVVHRRVSVLGSFDIMRATYRNHSFPLHAHAEFALGVVESGANRLRYRGASHNVGAGQIVIVHPGEMHTGEAISEDGWSYRMLYPPPSVVDAAVAAGADRGPRVTPFFPSPVLDDPALARRLVRMHRALESSDCALESESRFVEAMCALVSRHAARDGEGAPRIRAEPPAVRLAREFIEAHFTSVVRLSTLAELTGVSPFHLIRVFRASVGVPPYVYLAQLRMSHALSLLRQGRTLSQVAYLAGFSDQSHLTRQFKRAMGLPPGKYVRGLRQAGVSGDVPQ
jgi:AraC-like DNA-binding protein